MEMTVLEPIEGCTRIALTGRLDTQGAGKIELRFTAAVAPKRANAIVDIAGVSFLSSLGIRMLVSVAKTLTRADAKIILHSAQPVVAEALTMAALDEIISTVQDETAALALVRG